MRRADDMRINLNLMTKRRIYRWHIWPIYHVRHICPIWQMPGLNTEITATGGGAMALLKLQAKTAKPLLV